MNLIAPKSKPRPDGNSDSSCGGAAEASKLSDKELKAQAKEARKKELAAKKAARLAKKAADGGEEGDEKEADSVVGEDDA